MFKLCKLVFGKKKKKISCALGAQKFKGYQAGSQAVHTSGRLVSVLGNFQNEEPVIGFLEWLAEDPYF